MSNDDTQASQSSDSPRTALHEDPVVDVVLSEALVAGSGQLPDVVAVIDDPDGAFAAPLLQLGATDVRVFSDVGLSEMQPSSVREENPDGALFEGATLIVGRLPKSLAELEDLAESIARHAGPDVRVILGAREKHLRHSMNESLGKYFADVRGTRGVRKSRALVATTPKQSAPQFPRLAQLEELDLAVAARGGVFAGPTLDLGTRVLIQSLAAEQPGTIALPDRHEPGDASLAASSIHTAVDLGCGTGLLASVLARSFPEANVIATDASWWACASAAVTASENGFADRIEVLRGNAGEGIAEASADLVLCNPPFHSGRQVDPGLSNELFRGAARMLKPGGQLVTVFNSHLKHRHHLENIVGPTWQIDRTEKFTVTVSTRR